MDLARKIFCVAGHRFGVSLPDGADTDRVLRSYLPFEQDVKETEKNDGSSGLLFSLCAEQTRDGIGTCGSALKRLNEESPYIWINDRDDALVFGFSISDACPAFLVRVSPDLSLASIELPQACPPSLMSFALDNSAMLAYMLATACSDTLLVHASVVRYEGRGYAFTGRSGSGKSTHSRLWLQNIPGTVIVNDDNPVIRMLDGLPVVFGSPWSGKTPCWKNTSAPLQALVHIFQAPENRIERLRGVHAYASFITSCSNLRWKREISDGIHSCVEKVLGTCRSYKLYCLPDRDAALLSFRICAEQH